MSLAKGLSILFIFSKNQLLVSLTISTVFLVSISYISAPIFTISFLLLTLGFVCFSFSSCSVTPFLILFIYIFSFILHHFTRGFSTLSTFHGNVGAEYCAIKELEICLPRYGCPHTLIPWRLQGPAAMKHLSLNLEQPY